MPYTRQHRGRPLGSLPDTVSDSLLCRFPPLASFRSTPTLSTEGVQGNALLVTPRRQPTERMEVKAKVYNSKPLRTSAMENKEDSEDTKVDGEKEIMMELDKELKACLARERQKTDQMLALQNLLHESRKLVAAKDRLISEMEINFQEMESRYRALYEQERTEHGMTHTHLEMVRSALADAEQNMVLLAMKHGEEMDATVRRHEAELVQVRTELEEEILERDARLEKLKHQMAESLKGNSWERQQQLDELSKELSRVQSEADVLKLRVKSLQKASQSKQTSCENCERNVGKLSSERHLMAERETELKQLKALCSRLEKQLSQQDRLLAQSRSRRISMYPN